MPYEMFGAPGGLAVAQEEQTTQALATLKALSEVNDLPVKQAHARYYNAEADAKVTESAQMKMLQQISQGVDLTGGAAPADETPAQMALRLARPMATLSGLALKSGALKLGGELGDKAVGILQKGAAAQANQASEDLRRARTAKIQLDQQGSTYEWAAAAPENYHQFRLGLVEKAMSDPNAEALLYELPDSYEEGKLILGEKAAATIPAKDQLAQQTRTAVGTARIASLEASAESARAATNASRARVKQINQTIRLRDQNGGETSASREALNNERRQALKENRQLAQVREARLAGLAEAKDKATYAALPAAPKDLEKGKVYYVPGKGPAVYNGKGFELIRKPAAYISADALEDEADDGDDEGDE